jgi:protein JSN1
VLWIGNIGPTVTPEMLQQEFAQFGEVESVKVLPQKYCAFVAFKDEKNAVTAKDEMHGQIIGGQYIRVKFRKRQDPALAALSPESQPLPQSSQSKGYYMQ